MKIINPVIWADYPDPDLIRVGDAYYMVSTTMFFMPGGPILKSYDLVHWEIVSYIFDKIEGYETNVGAGYGRGQWATSLREHNGKYYAFFTCLDLKKTFLYCTDDLEKSGWDRIDFDGMYHDASLLFVEDKGYLFYQKGGAGDVWLAEWKDDMSGFVPGSDRMIFSPPIEGMALRCEGCRGLYKDGYIYLFFIDIPKGGGRREWVYRAKSVDGPYESRLIADSTCGMWNIGVAQGMPIDTPSGDWYMILFGDCGSVGRLPFLFPLSWEEGWPVVGGDLGMQREYDLPLQDAGRKPVIFSDDFNRAENTLPLFWQWNHTPDHSLWSLTERAGWLRLKAVPATELMNAKNTLSQRTCGPTCAFTVELDVSALAPGGRAGLAALQWDCAMAGVRVNEDGSRSLFTARREEGDPRMGPATEQTDRWETSITADTLTLRADFDFREGIDTVQFSYQLPGGGFCPCGDPMVTHFNLRYFCGTRAALFCYGAGQADFRNFTAEQEIWN